MSIQTVTTVETIALNIGTAGVLIWSSVFPTIGDGALGWLKAGALATAIVMNVITAVRRWQNKNNKKEE